MHRKAIAVFALTLAGCASPTVVETVKVGDTGMTCPQLQVQYQEAENFRLAADKEKGVTGGNVARAILFWPAVVGSFSNANDAISAANARKTHLANLMNQKSCPTPVVAPPPPATPAAPAQTPA